MKNGMYASVKNLQNNRIDALDGEVGKISQVYFRDDTWEIRYIEIELDGGLERWRRRVLIDPNAVNFSRGFADRIFLRISKDEVQKSRDSDSDPPSVEDRGIEYREPCAEYVESVATPDKAPVPDSLNDAMPSSSESCVAEAEGIHLRGSNEVLGYSLLTRDRHRGRIKDFIFDDLPWLIKYIEVSTGGLFDRKAALIAPLWVHEVSWTSRVVRTFRSMRTIRQAPEFHSIDQLTPGYEDLLLMYYEAGPTGKPFGLKPLTRGLR